MQMWASIRIWSFLPRISGEWIASCCSPRRSLETMRALASDSLVKNESEQGYVMAQHNADRVADWNGQSGERWVAHQARLDARLAVFGQAAIEAAAPAAGERVLD